MKETKLLKQIVLYLDNRFNRELGEFFGKLIFHYPKEFYQNPKKINNLIKK